MFHKNSRIGSISFLTIFLAVAGFLLVPLTTSCSAFVTQMSEAQAAETLQILTRDGKLPPEATVLQIENRFAKTKTGALAKLLRARIHFETNDFNGAAQILDSTVFREKTTVADYALWLRGKSLMQAGRQAEAINVFAELANGFPNSLRAREAALLWANSQLQNEQTDKIPNFLKNLADKNDADALLLTAKSFEVQNNAAQAIAFYRRVYFYAPGTAASKEAETKLTSLQQSLAPQTAEEIRVRADKLYDAKNYADAATAYTTLLSSFQNPNFAQINLRRVIAYANARKTPEAQLAFNLIPQSANEKEQGFYELARAFAKAKQWTQARQITEEMRRTFPSSKWTPKALVEVGMAAGDAKTTPDESYFLKTAVASYPNSIEVAQAQFELAWLEHDNKNFAQSAQMLTEHLARYVDRDTTNRGKAGYWAARDSERAGKTAEACALYDGEIYRYGANWYGYLALQRLTTLRGQGKCQTAQQLPADSLVPKAVANLKVVTVAPETATAKELERVDNAAELGLIGYFDWAIEELQNAKETAQESPKINFALAKLYRQRGDNVGALVALAKSYPDYSQMFPEELSPEEWDIFYPLTNWNEIKTWAKARNLDAYQVAGFIRQESVFNPRAKSGANAYGLMQLLIPTARTVARKYGSATTEIYGETLFQPAVNIELGTGYIRDQFDKFGRVEFVAVAYNAGPGRVPQWQATLPFDMDEFVEAIPFRETKGYVQGIIRNTAQYRRLYDENGKFKSNVGTKTLRAAINGKTREQIVRELPEIIIDSVNSEE